MPRKSKQELLADDLSKALDASIKAHKYLERALGRLPKNKPVPIPVGSDLYKRYGATTVQNVLKDLYLPEATAGYELGLLPGLMDVLEDLKKLAAGETGFTL